VIEKHLKKTTVAKIPLNESVILSAVNKGVPVVASRDRTKSPVKEFLDFSDQIFNTLMTAGGDEEDETDDKKGKKIGFGLLGRN
jgi:hypothetical protein